MRLLNLSIFLVLVSGTTFCQNTYSKLINYPETNANVGLHIYPINEKLILLSAHLCQTVAEENAVCSMIGEYDFNGELIEKYLLENFEVVRGSISLLENDTLLFYGIDKSIERNTLSFGRYDINNGPSTTFNVGFYEGQHYACEGILELNNAYYTYGHFDDLNPGERIKGYVKKFNKDFSEELGSWVYEENEILRISDMRVTPDSNLVFSFFENKVGPGPDINVRVIKIDTLGNVLIQKDIENGNASGFNRINLDVDKEGYVYFNYDISFDHVIAKMHPNMEDIIWELELPSDYFPFDRGYGVTEIKIAANGDILAVGDVDYFHLELERTFSCFITRISPDGEIKWVKILTHEITEPNVFAQNYAESYLYDVVELPNGNIVATGQVIEATFDGPKQQLLLVSLDENGCTETFGIDCADDIYVLNGGESFPIYTSTSSLNIADEKFVYPNPVHDQLYLEIEGQNWSYQILNLQGQQVMQGIYQDHIEARKLPSGIYFLQLQQDGGFYKVIKFAKQ